MGRGKGGGGASQRKSGIQSKMERYSNPKYWFCFEKNGPWLTLTNGVYVDLSVTLDNHGDEQSVSSKDVGFKQQHEQSTSENCIRLCQKLLWCSYQPVIAGCQLPCSLNAWKPQSRRVWRKHKWQFVHGCLSQKNRLNNGLWNTPGNNR